MWSLKLFVGYILVS